MGRIRLLLCAAITLTILSFGIISCGPEQSTRDKETEQIQETYVKQKAAYDTVNGNYVGTMRAIEVNENAPPRNVRVRVMIRTFIEMLPSANRVEYIPVPTLIGALNGITSDNIAWPFTKGYFDPATKTLQMTGSNDNVFIFLELKAVGKKWIGKITRGRYDSPIELTLDN